MLDQFTTNWNYPTAVRTGIGRVNDLPEICQSLGVNNPLIVTDPGLHDLPMLRAAHELCSTQLNDCGLFFDIKANPNEKNVAQGVLACKQGAHDGVIAFGGGSALDAGKAIALMVGQSDSIWNFEDIGDNHLRVNVDGILPIVAVPTTSGTGSEVGRSSIITDSERKAKKIIFHAKMMPAAVVLDAELTCGLPAQLTAATGMDALSHNLEALCSPIYHPMARGIAMEGIRLIKDCLPAAVADGSDLEARTHMQVASCMGATAFQKGLGAMHALAHPLGAVFDAHHGMLNAILMPYVLKANKKAIGEDLTDASRYINLSNPGFQSFFDWVLELRSQLNIPHTLAEIDIDDAQIETIANMAIADPTASTNPIQFTTAEYRDICLNAIRGIL
ncbi:MAG: iron-containing alcohol dehydrogenase [Pseudomonadales bacterium]